VVQIWSRNTLKFRGDETFELHRVAALPGFIGLLKIRSPEVDFHVFWYKTVNYWCENEQANVKVAGHVQFLCLARHTLEPLAWHWSHSVW